MTNLKDYLPKSGVWCFLTYSYYGSSVKLLDLYLTGLVSLISLKMQKKPIILYSYGKKKKKKNRDPLKWRLII